MTLQELQNIKVNDSIPLRKLVNEFLIYINTHYPLRLDYFNLPINRTNESNNYVIYKDNIMTLYLNDFKNVKSMGSQVLQYNDPLINEYIKKLTEYFGHMPDYLLWRWTPNGLQIFGSRQAYSRHIQDVFYKYTHKKITMNDIRKIHESTIIQDSKYNMLTNEQKNNKHNTLLHSTNTAHNSYNKQLPK